MQEDISVGWFYAKEIWKLIAKPDLYLWMHPACMNLLFTSL